MADATDRTAENVAHVERFLAAFDRRWPAKQELDELLAADVRFVERPNLVSPAGAERDTQAMRAGVEAGRKLLAWQRYEVRDHVAHGDVVVTRMRWTGEFVRARVDIEGLFSTGRGHDTSPTPPARR